MASRVVAYTRVSTADQAEHGISLDAQRAKLQAYAQLYDLTIIATETDAGLSGKSLERPGLARALETMKTAHADGLLVCKMDRLTRSVRDLCHLMDEYFAHGAFALLSVTEQLDTRTAGGRLVIKMFGAVSEWEREVIGERTSAALQHKKANGEFTGGKAAPYGYGVDSAGYKRPIQREQDVLQLVKAMRFRGFSLRVIATDLRKLGKVSRSGRPFTAEQIRRMVS